MMPQHLSSSAPSVATLKRKAEKEVEEGTQLHPPLDLGDVALTPCM
jgi:hypothetical protein